MCSNNFSLTLFLELTSSSNIFLFYSVIFVNIEQVILFDKKLLKGHWSPIAG